MFLRRNFRPAPRAALLILLLLLAVPPVSLHARAPDAQEFAYTRTQSLTTIDIIERLKRHHFSKLPVDDALSRRLLDNYLHNLDGNRSVLLRSDIDEFENWRTTLDDELLEGRLDAGFAIYRRYDERLETRLSYASTHMHELIAAMDFTRDEVMVLDRDGMDWPANAAEADEIWRKQLKASVLSLKLAGKSMPEIEKLLRKRYKDQLRRLGQVNSEDVYQLYMNSFTELFDPHTNYLSPRNSENFNMNMRLSLEGIGAVLQQDEEFTKVARLVPGGPAHRQGVLRQSDRIVAVGEGEKGKLTDVVGWRLDDVVDLIRGPKGSTVRLEIVRGNGASEEHQQISIVREQVKLEEQAAKSEVLELPDAAGRTHKIGVIDIPAFYADFDAMQRGDADFRSTTRDVAKLLDELQEQQVEGIVIDLRDNGGGSLEEANALTGLFIESGFTVQIRHSSETIERRQKFRGREYYNGPLVVLVNRLSASASEIFAGAIQDYGRGLIVGTQTFGKGTVQALTPLNHGQLKLTESKFYRISGDSTQHRGVVPDIQLPTIYDLSEVGESALDSALPWDRIAPVRHRVYHDLAPILDTLREMHTERARKNPDYVYLQSRLQLAEKYDRENTLSLSEPIRLKERDRMRAEELRLENERRSAKGLPPISSLEEAEDQDESDTVADTSDDADADADAEQADSADTAHGEETDDVLLTESGNILLDAINLSHRVATRH